MFRMLLWKEFRACWIPGLLALLASAVVAVFLVYDFDTPFLHGIDIFDRKLATRIGWPMVGQDIPYVVGLISICLGAFLGLIQTAFEATQGTAPLLIHVAGPRRRIVAGKLLVGLAIFAVSLMMPLVAGFSFVVGGSDPTPFPTWKETAYPWVMAGLGIVAYLGILGVGMHAWGAGFNRRNNQAVTGFVATATGIIATFSMPRPGAALTLLALTALFAIVWAFAGYEAAEF